MKNKLAQPAMESMSETEDDPALDPVLSVVIPVYQEAETIREVLKELCKTLEDWGKAYEVLVVDDGSTDGTGDVLFTLEKDLYSNLTVIQHPYNKGNGSALKSGIRRARGEWIACMDGDGQHVPSELPNLLALREQYDLIVGARDSSYFGRFYRKWANTIYNTFSSWVARFEIRDLTSGFRLYRARVLKQYVEHFPPRFSCEVTGTLIFLKAGYDVEFVPVTVKQRQGGSSKIRPFRDGARFFVIIFKIVLMFEPLRFFLPLSMVSFGLASGLTGYACWVKGRPFIPNAAVILSVMGVLVLLMGMISEQISTLQLTSHRSVQEQ